MFWKSSGVVRFYLGPLLEGQMRTAKLKSAYNSLIIGPRGFGALSLRWIQFASVLRCARSSSWFSYLPPGSPEGDYNLHHVRVYVRACVGACMRACVRVSRSFL